MNRIYSVTFCVCGSQCPITPKHIVAQVILTDGTEVYVNFSEDASERTMMVQLWRMFNKKQKLKRKGEEAQW